MSRDLKATYIALSCALQPRARDLRRQDGWAKRGTPSAAFDGIRAGVRADRSQFFKEVSRPFFGANREGAKISQGTLDCVRAFSETDFTGDLKKFDRPTLIIHGDDDQIVPIGAAGLASAKIVKNSTLKVYPGAPHGLTITRKYQVNADVLAFLKA